MRTSLTLLAIGFALLFASGVASADPVLYLEDGDTGISVTVTDNGAGDLDATVGVINFSGGLGGTVWGIVFTAGIGNDHILGQAMHVTSVQVSSGGAGSLKIGFSETGFEYDTNPVTIRSEIGGFAGASVSVAWGADSNNLLWSGGSPSTFTGNATAGPWLMGAFSATNDFVGDYAPGPFSMSQMVTVKHTGAGQVTSFDSHISAMPEPGTLALVGLALVGAAVYRRRRKQ